MNIYVRRKRPKPFGGLLFTFALGVAIGFSIAYAYFRNEERTVPSETAPITTQAETPASPEALVTPIAPPAETPAIETAPDETPPAETSTKTADPLRPGRFLFLGVDGMTLDDETKALLSEIQPGGVVLKADDLSSADAVAALVAQIKDAVGLGKGIADPPLIAVAQEGGTVNPFKIDIAPSAEELGLKKDPDAARKAGLAAGEAAVKRGVGVLFAPVLNVLDKEVKEGEEAYVARDRVFGGDQGDVKTMGLAMADGILEAGAGPITKYYPGTGLKRGNEGASVYVIDATARRLAELMYPFSEAAAQGVPGILVGHVAVPEIDRKSPNRPASISPVLVQMILRDKFHYEGFVLADDISGDTIRAQCPPDGALVESLEAGCDGALFLDESPERIRATCNAFRNALATGTLTEDGLMQSHQRWQALAERLMKPTVPPVQEALPAPPEPEVPPSLSVPETPVIPAKPETPSDDGSKPAPGNEPVDVPEPSVVEAQPASSPASTQDARPEEEPVPQPPNTEKIVHEITRGETLGKIAAKYGVSRDDILTWNGKADTSIKYGYKLIIYRPIKESAATQTEPESEDKAQPVEEPVPTPPTDASSATTESATGPTAASEPDAAAMTEPEVTTEPTEVPPTASSNPAPATPADAPVAATKSTPDETVLTHTVVKGETIYRIAAKYKTTVQRIIEMNELDQADSLKVGQKLRVPAPDTKQ